MSTTSDVGGESEAVLAFIRERQAEVMRDAIASLSSCSADELPSVVHSIHGTLGSYQLDEAHGNIAALARLLADPATTPVEAAAARATTVDALRRLDEARTAESQSVVAESAR
jgi:hypothetical protein